MKRFLQASVLLLVSFSQAQAEDFWHDSVRACVVGGGVIGTASALMLYSAATTVTGGATLALPAGPVVVGNTIFGCGLGTIGTMLIYGLGNLYQNMASPQVTFAQPVVNTAPAHAAPIAEPEVIAEPVNSEQK